MKQVKGGFLVIARIKRELIYTTKTLYIQLSDKTTYSVKVIAEYNSKVSLARGLIGSPLFSLYSYVYIIWGTR